MGAWLQQIFGDDSARSTLTLYQVAARAILIYLIGLAIVRLGKSRLISRVTSIDIILGFVLGSVLGRGILGAATIPDTTVATAALVATHWILTWVACRSHRVGELIKGRSKQIVAEGQPLTAAMLASHVSMHDLEESMRLHGYDQLSDIRAAFKERNGEISILAATKK